MAMESNGNLPDYAVRKQNYSSYAAQGLAGSGDGKRRSIYNKQQNIEKRRKEEI